MMDATCPYCGQVLEKKPKRKKKCPHCKNYIHVRRLPPNYDETVFLTEEDAMKLDLAQERAAFRERWLGTLRSYGISEKDFDAHKAELAKKFGHGPSDGDVIWGLFNTVVDRATKEGDLQGLKQLYFDMALFLYKEGKPFLHLRQQAARMELLAYRQWGQEEVEILSAGNSCSACKELGGKTFSVEDALEQMPIPVDGCTYQMYSREDGWCRCTYLPALDID